MHAYAVNGGRVEAHTNGLRLSTPAQDGAAYCDAQLDDYSTDRPFSFLHRAPCVMRVRARFSHPAGALKGTAGFGFWNHPFGSGGGAIPRSLWFFYGSPESRLRFSRFSNGHGFVAGMLDGLPLSRGRRRNETPKTVTPDRITERTEIDTRAGEHDISTPSRLLLRLSQWLTGFRPLMAPLVRVAQRIFYAPERQLAIDLTAWHDYRLEWSTQWARWFIDNALVFESPNPPPGPLGFVAWIDNYAARFSEDGEFRFSHLAHDAQWLEIEFDRMADAGATQVADT
jgi:hypothetical protein